MNRLISRLAVVSTIIALMGSTTLLLAADAEKPAPQKKAAAEKKAPAEKKAATTPRGTTYRGTVATLDRTAMTLTVTNKSSSRVFQISSETKLFKKDKPATVSELVIGDVVGGSYVTNADKLMLLTVRDAGPDTAAAKAEEKKAKAAAKAEKKADKAEKKSEKLMEPMQK